MRETIKAAAARFNLPAVLVAGTFSNEIEESDLFKSSAQQVAVARRGGNRGKGVSGFTRSAMPRGAPGPGL